MSEKKKVFPKLKKKLQDFLTDESWEITKKDALGIAAGAALMAGALEVWAADRNAFTTYNVRFGEGYYQASCSATVKSKHISWIVNWHISKMPIIEQDSAWHASHASCGRWHW